MHRPDAFEQGGQARSTSNVFRTRQFSQAGELEDLLWAGRQKRTDFGRFLSPKGPDS